MEKRLTKNNVEAAMNSAARDVVGGTCEFDIFNDTACLVAAIKELGAAHDICFAYQADGKWVWMKTGLLPSPNEKDYTGRSLEEVVGLAAMDVVRCTQGGNE